MVEQTNEELREHIAKLESVLRGILDWSATAAVDLTPTGFEEWSLLVPPGPSYSVLQADPPAPYNSTWRMDQWVNNHLRASIDQLATGIQILAISFHTHRGDAGLVRDIIKAREVIRGAHDSLWQAQVRMRRNQETDKS
jgi:hypothetical protein